MNRTLRLFALLALAALPARATNIVVVNNDSPGEGFNDSTPVAPLPGNPGTTRGAQRLNVLNAAADYWERRLVSNVNIKIDARMDPLTPCTAGGGVLGSAGPMVVHANFTGNPLASTWYVGALADSRFGADLGPLYDDIRARFNTRVDGDATCFTTGEWWYGLGEPAPLGTFDFYTTVLHELGHGLGFLTLVDLATGTRCCESSQLDDAYMVKLEDHELGLKWNQLTNAQRVASAKNTNYLHWTGAQAMAAGSALSAGKTTAGHINMYSPSTLSPGSSVSHWTNGLTPDEVMEPFLSNTASNLVTTALLADLGWQVRPILFGDGFEAGGTAFWSPVTP
jgi:hypothetical protein